MIQKPLLILLGIMLLTAANKLIAQNVVALTDNNMLYVFNASNPSMASTPMPLNNIPSGMEVVGMDVRPATGEIYFLAYNFTTNFAQLFKAADTTFMLTSVGTGIPNFALSGQVGFDFNPTVDRIRVVSSAEHDYRLHPVTGALVATDGTIAYAATDVNNGVNPSIGSGAYTNSYIGATSTALYNYDDSLNVLTVQNPPNNGVQNTIGSSGISVNWNNPTSDMDIYFNPTTMQNMAYFVANTGMSNMDSLYMMNLSTGQLSNPMAINMAVKDIAILIMGNTPVPSGQLVHALTTNNNLISFYTGNANHIRSQVALSGLSNGYTLVGMDVRPTDLKLYGLAYNSALMSAKVYIINPMTGVATAVTADSIANINLNGSVGVDFNPVADRMRVVTSNNFNYRINQLTGLLAANDTALNFATGDMHVGIDPNVATIAYTGSKVGSTATILYAYDDSLNMLLTQTPPNAGVLNTKGSSGIMVNAVDRTTDMDIYYNHVTKTDVPYFVANTTNNNDKLYMMNLTTGAATEVGMIGLGIAIRDIAIQLDSTPMNTALNKVGNQNITSINVFPNPVSTTLQVDVTLKKGSPTTITLFDMTGKMVDKRQYNTISTEFSTHFDAQQLQNGIYFLRITTDGETVTQKVIKQ